MENAPTAPSANMTDNNATRSPSPSDAPAPGRLATQLQKVFDSALAHTVKTCNYNNFAACFPTPAARRPEVLQSVWQQIVGKIETKARSEFGGIMGERDVVRGLNDLEGLVKDARGRKEVWEREGGEKAVAWVLLIWGRQTFGDVLGLMNESRPHSLPPEALFGAHLAPELEPIAREMQGRIDVVSLENDRLAENITQQKDEVEALVRQLEAVVRDLEGANETLGAIVDDQGLRQEVVDIQKDLNGSKL